jgi:hypothetical protein
MSEKINAQKSFESSAGNSATEISELNRRKNFSQREVGLTHPDNSSFIRLTDSGDIEIFSAPGVGIVINGSTKTISLFADNIKFHTKEDGLKWNSMEFNHSATLFSEPALVSGNDKSYNPAFLNMDHYIKNLDLIDEEDSQQTVTINGSYAYRETTDTDVVSVNLLENSVLDNYFTKQQITLIQSSWDRYGEQYKNLVNSAEAIGDFTNKIKDYMDDGYSIDQAINKVVESIGDNNV